MLALTFKHNYQPCQRSNSISERKTGKKEGSEGGREEGQVE